jgi:hypothetical protein
MIVIDIEFFGAGGGSIFSEGAGRRGAPCPVAHRKVIIMMAARHGLPAVFLPTLRHPGRPDRIRA